MSIIRKCIPYRPKSTAISTYCHRYNPLIQSTKSIAIDYFSDLHCDKYIYDSPPSPLRHIIKNPASDICIVSGNIGFYTHRNVYTFIKYLTDIYSKVYIVLGNCDMELLPRDSFSLVVNNYVDCVINYLTDKCDNITIIYKAVIPIHPNINLIACTLWSDTADKNHWRYREFLDHRSFIEKSIIESKSANKKAIIATHYPPSLDMLLPRYLYDSVDKHASNLNYIFKSGGFEEWICGHIDASITTNISGIPCSIHSVYKHPHDYRAAFRPKTIHIECE